VKDTDRAYLAAMIDGEGCIHITNTHVTRKDIKGNPRKRYNRLMVIVVNTDRLLMETVKKRSNHKGRMIRVSPQNDRCRPQYRLEWRGKYAAAFLSEVEAFMSPRKQEQALVGIEFYERCMQKTVSHAGLTKENLKERTYYEQRLKHLKT